MGKSPGSALFEACFPASAPGLADALHGIDAVCRAHAFPADLVSRVRIVVEELFTNTIKYGYCGDSEKPVRLALSVAKGLMTLIFEDEAPAFDPTRYEIPAHRNPEHGPEGRSGIAMVMGLSKSAMYVRLAGGNRLTLTLKS